MKEDPIFRIFLRAKLQRARTIKITSFSMHIRRVLVQGTDATNQRAYISYLVAQAESFLSSPFFYLSFDVFSRACCLTMMQSIIIDEGINLERISETANILTLMHVQYYLFSRHDTQLASLDGYVYNSY